MQKFTNKMLNIIRLNFAIKLFLLHFTKKLSISLHSLIHLLSICTYKTASGRLGKSYKDNSIFIMNYITTISKNKNKQNLFIKQIIVEIIAYFEEILSCGKSW